MRDGTVGAGSYPHFDAAYFAIKGGNLSLNAIHNKAGASGVINDLVTGDTQVAFLNAASTLAMVKAGKLKPLAVVNTKRLDIYPDVPTMAEAGFGDVGTIAWQGLFAPAATPQPVLDALFKAATAALEAPTAKETFAKQNFIVVPNKSLADSEDVARRRDQALGRHHQAGQDRDGQLRLLRLQRIAAFPLPPCGGGAPKGRRGRQHNRLACDPPPSGATRHLPRKGGGESRR